MSENLLSSLNDSQKIAAQHIDGSLLILAGAGSGKTKTITTRLAYLISIGIDPSSILTLTFTNKAAREMRERAFSMIDNSQMNTLPLLCTFHKFGLLFLKFHMSELGRKNNFIIIDTDDKKRILKSIDKEITTSLLVSEISKYKNTLLTPSEAKAAAQLKLYQQIAEIYEKYEDYLLQNNLVDFDDLLLLPYLIMKNNENLANETSQRYKYIKEDKYQDKNELQYKLIKIILST